MAILLLALFIGVPILEIAVFIQAGALIGLWPTLAGIVITAIIGSFLLRWQGLATLGRLRQELDRGAVPTRELFDGACILLAGVLLLTPGFVTDTVGFLLFVPAVRTALLAFLAQRVTLEAGIGGIREPRGPADTARPGPPPGPPPGPRPGPPPGRAPGPSAGSSRWGRGPDRNGEGAGRRGRPPDIIEAEFEEVDPQDPKADNR